MSLRLVERTKVCANPDCYRAGQPQSWSQFPVRTRWPDGSVRNVHSRCRVCRAEECRRKRQEKPLSEGQREADRAKRRQQYHARMNDPEYAARVKAERREALKGRYARDPRWAARNRASSARYLAKLRQDPEKWAAYKAKARERRQRRAQQRRVMLDIGPLRDWVEREVRALASQHGGDIHAGGSVLCSRGDLDPRTLYRWRHEQHTVELDAVDRFACHYGEPRLVADLWPDFYEADAA